MDERATSRGVDPNADPFRALRVAGIACVSLLVGLALAHAWRVPFHAGDDLHWLSNASAGLREIWTGASPFNHYRPVFGSWLLAIRTLFGDSPLTLGLASLLAYLAVGGIVYWALRGLTSRGRALLAAVVVTLHPARQQQLLWMSAGIDLLCLAFTMLTIGLALRALRRERAGASMLAGIALATALGTLSKEVALLLPAILLLLPVACSWKRKIIVAAVSAVAALPAVIGGAVLLVGGGRPAGLLGLAGSRGALLYPSRLVWPGDLHAWLYHANTVGDYTAPLIVAAVTLAVGLWLAMAWRGRWGAAELRLAALLGIAGFAPWLIRLDDRAIGLGVVAFGLLVAGATVRSRAATAAVMALLVVTLAWSPLWLRWESRWVEAAEASGRIVESWRSWRAQAGPDRTLIGLAPVSMVGWTCEVVGLREVDPCARGLFALLGSSPVPPAQVSRLGPGSSLEIATTGGSILRWSSGADPEWGILEIERGADGYVRRAVVDPERLGRSVARGSCRGVDVRRWDGSAFVPLP